jgi:hypothetical protein
MATGIIFTHEGNKFKVELKQKMKMYEVSLYIHGWYKKNGIEGMRWVKLSSLMTYQNNLFFLKEIMLDSLPAEEAF